jgi:hypothetical protein
MNKVLLLPTDELRVHEEIDANQVERVVKSMRESGRFFPPLLVDFESKVILDGHHRLEACKRLGCKRIPCYCVDYLRDDGILLESWRPDVRLTKPDVIQMGLSDRVYPQKTTRHIYKLPDWVTPVPLAELVNGA